MKLWSIRKYINEDKVGVKQEGTNKPVIPSSTILFGKSSNIEHIPIMRSISCCINNILVGSLVFGIFLKNERERWIYRKKMKDSSKIKKAPSTKKTKKFKIKKEPTVKD